MDKTEEKRPLGRHKCRWEGNIKVVLREIECGGVDRINLALCLHVFRSRDSIFGIATGYGLDTRGVGVRVSVGSRIFSTPRCSDRIWGPSSLLANGYRDLFRRG
jgi:hypothetical protein